MPPAFDAAPAGLGSRIGDDPVAWKRELQERLDHELVDELAGVSVRNTCASHRSSAMPTLRLPC
jgi:hypothetical protein